MKRTRPRRVSKKRASLSVAYRLAKGTLMADADGRCQARLPGCTGAGQDAHHVIPKGQGGAHLPGVRGQRLALLCRSCHSAVTLSPELGRRIGVVERLLPRS